MKKTFTIILGLLIYSTLWAQSSSQLNSYLANRSKVYQQDFLYEGCKLNLSSDGEELMVQLCIVEPMIQMRLLMQESSIYIDPAGKRRDKYAIFLPSANQVKNIMGEMQPPDPMQRRGDRQRPDLTTLIHALNSVGAIWDENGEPQLLDRDRFNVVLDSSRDMLVYSILVPMKSLLKDKKHSDTWSVGLYSALSDRMPPAPMEAPTETPPPPRGQRDKGPDEGLQRMLQKNINHWVNVPMSNVYAAGSASGSAMGKTDDGHGENLLQWRDDTCAIAVRCSKESLSFRVAFFDPQLQMCTLMQGVTFELNVGGKSVKVTFPSAMLVRDSVKHHPNEITPFVPHRDSVNRPDIRYLLSYLNEIPPQVNGEIIDSVVMSRIEVIPDLESLYYSLDAMTHSIALDDRWTVSIQTDDSQKVKGEFANRNKPANISDQRGMTFDRKYTLEKAHE